MKKVIAIVLLCCMVAVALVACTGNKKPNKGTEAPSGSNGDATGGNGTNGGQATAGGDLGTDEYGQSKYETMDVSDKDFGGETIVIITRDNTTGRREWGKAPGTDASELDEIERAIEKRNTLIQDELNLNVAVEAINANEFHAYLGNIQNMIIEDVRSGKGDYDIASQYSYCAGFVDVRSAHANLLDNQAFPEFDFELPCWNQAILENIVLNDKLYICAGDVNLSVFDLAMVMFVNKNLYEQKAGQMGAPDDLMAHIMGTKADMSDGQWTWLDFQKWGDLYEGGGTNGCEGIHGFANNAWFSDALYASFELDFVNKNSNGRFEFNIRNNDKAETVLSSVRTTFQSQGAIGVQTGAITVSTKDPHQGVKCTCGKGAVVQHFATDETVFYVDKLYGEESVIDAIANMQSTFYVAPLPKWEASQTSYETTSQDYYNLVSVLNHSDLADGRGEMISTYLQYANDRSYTDIRAYYIERIVKPTLTSPGAIGDFEENAIAIIDHILSNLYFDVVTIYSNSFGDILTTLWRYTVSDTVTVTDKFDSDPNFENSIESFNEWIYS